MQVILLEKIRNLGSLGSKVKVKPGYARNFLLPQGKAASATEANLAKFEAQRAEHEAREAEQVKASTARAEKLSALGVITIAAKVAEEGKLYGSVSIIDIADAINKAGGKVERSEVKLPTGPIRHIGEYDVDVYVHGDIAVTIKISVVAG